MSSPKRADSAAAILVTPAGQYLLQHRENKKSVDFPGMWGLFGGARDRGETIEAALRRELREELALDVDHARKFMVATFDISRYRRWRCRRTYFEVVIAAAAVDRLVLGEGQAMGLFGLPDVARLGPEIIPYDLSAIMLHARLSTGAANHPEEPDARRHHLRSRPDRRGRALLHHA
jgi:8-oxo-dGTP pyrophosphatase MutT (NUDIX family)